MRRSNKNALVSLADGIAELSSAAASKRAVVRVDAVEKPLRPRVPRHGIVLRWRRPITRKSRFGRRLSLRLFLGYRSCLGQALLFTRCRQKALGRWDQSLLWTSSIFFPQFLLRSEPSRVDDVCWNRIQPRLAYRCPQGMSVMVNKQRRIFIRMSEEKWQSMFSAAKLNTNFSDGFAK